MTTTDDREAEMRELAARLYFEVGKTDAGFSLYRESGVDHPVRHDGLSIDEAEDLLNKWKLRGLHGG
jgi:hypothetical protein